MNDRYARYGAAAGILFAAPWRVNPGYCIFGKVHL